MEFSEEWKSIFPVGSVFEAPLLISKNPKTLGPLFFNPRPQTTTLLFNSPSLSPPLLNPPPSISLPTFLSASTLCDSLIPPSTASSLTSLFGPQHQNIASPSLLLSHNRLQFLKCPLGDTVLVFFPTGSNHDQVGFLLLSVKDKTLVAIVEKGGAVFTANKSLGERIVRILVNQVEDSACFGSKSDIFGYLLVYTLYSVHWFCVKMSEVSERKPVLAYLGCKVFKTCSVTGACWNPHLPEESMVLLENGSLFLFDLESDMVGSNVTYFKGTKLKFSWDDPRSNSRKCKWLGCEFSWHPRIVVVARSDAVFIVDWRCDEYKVTCLAKIDMFGVYASAQKERFLAFSKAVSDHFHFVLASDSMLVLYDVCKPLTPVLQWTHGLDKPRYIDVFRLSQLRSNSKDNTHQWANASGFGIIVGSFWNCEFGLFCYGPPAPPCKGSFASEISKISKSFYAWELPSNFVLLDQGCQCGSCLVGEEFWKDALPEWIDWQQKKDIVLGFGILSNDLSSLHFEPDDFGGFTLVRLMSSAKLESQAYYASYELVRKLEVHGDPLLHSEDTLPYIWNEEKYMFPRRFKYLKFDYLYGYLNGNLSQVLDSNMEMLCKGALEKESFNLECHEMLCEKLKVCGFSRFRTSPAVNVVFNDICSPTSIHEVASRKMWADLPMEILQLAFSSYAECLDRLCFDQKKVALESLVVPDQPQLPPFFLRKPSSHSNRWSHKLHPNDALVGPVLPLPILVTLHELRNGCPNSQVKVGFSPEVEFNNQCDEIMQVAKELAVSNSSSELIDNHVVSLADDRDDVCVDFGRPKSFLLYHPAMLHCSTDQQVHGGCLFKDDKFTSVIAKGHEKQPTCNDKVTTVNKAFFDDLCPIDLKINCGVLDFSTTELNAYNSLKRHLSKWQEGFTPYREFCAHFDA